MKIEICNKNEIEKVLLLQKEFLNENCCNGICLDSKEELENETVF